MFGFLFMSLFQFWFQLCLPFPFFGFLNLDFLQNPWVRSCLSWRKTVPQEFFFGQVLFSVIPVILILLPVSGWKIKFCCLLSIFFSLINSLKFSRFWWLWYDFNLTHQMMLRVEDYQWMVPPWSHVPDIMFAVSILAS